MPGGAAKRPIGVGIIGLSPGESWSALAHVPALSALPEFRIVAVATSRRESADAAAAWLGIEHGYDDHEALIADPAVDLVVVTVKIPQHRSPVLAAIRAGKPVYCEWALGRSLAETAELAASARDAGVRTAIGLQARSSPGFAYVRDLVRSGFVGEVLSTSLVGSAMQWSAEVPARAAYIHDRDNGATMAVIPFGHTIDAVCWCLGDFREGVATSRVMRPQVKVIETGERLPSTGEDQLALSGVLENGAVASVHYRGGASAGMNLMWEINGSEGDLQVTAASGHGQMANLSITGARHGDGGLKPLPIPDTFRHGLPPISMFADNVAQAYRALAFDLADGGRRVPDFDDALARHAMIDAVTTAAAEQRPITFAGQP